MSFYLTLPLCLCPLFPSLFSSILPQSRTHSFAFARGGPGLSLLLQTFIHRCCPPLFRPLFLLLICCPPHLSAHFSFLLFVPISSAQMRCCVLRRVCTFLITSSCLGISWAKWSCNETEYCCANTHQPGLEVFWCVCRCICVCACACTCTS